MNCVPLSANIDSGIPYGKSLLLRKDAATRGVGVLFIWMARVNFKYRSVMTKRKRFPELVFVNRPRLSIAMNSNAPFAVKSLSFFCA